LMGLEIHFITNIIHRLLMKLITMVLMEVQFL